MNFSEEQIRKAIESAYQGAINPREDFTTRVLEKLNESEFRPRRGEIIALTNREGQQGYYRRFDRMEVDSFVCIFDGSDSEISLWSTARLLTLDEHGPDVRAMQEALEKLGGFDFSLNDAAPKIIKEALKHRIPE